MHSLLALRALDRQTDKQTDRRIAALLNAPNRRAVRRNKCIGLAHRPRCTPAASVLSLVSHFNTRLTGQTDGETPDWCFIAFRCGRGWCNK